MAFYRKEGFVLPLSSRIIFLFIRILKIVVLIIIISSRVGKVEGCIVVIYIYIYSDQIKCINLPIPIDDTWSIQGFWIGVKIYKWKENQTIIQYINLGKKKERVNWTWTSAGIQPIGSSWSWMFVNYKLKIVQLNLQTPKVTLWFLR